MDNLDVPSIAEVEELPLNARVAFAARCARRALPFFTKSWPAAPREHVEALRIAVEAAEEAARIAFVITDRCGLAAEAACKAADKAGVDAAALAARSAACAGLVASNPQSGALWAAGATAVKAGARAKLVQADFSLLRDLCRRHGWKDTTPVAPSVFGPLGSSSH